MLELTKTDSSNSDFIELVMLLDADLHVRDGDDHSFYAQFNKIDSIKNAIVAYQDGIPVGCGAFKLYADKVAEVKRMFVASEFRGQGIAGEILAELENWAAASGYEKLILETGKMQPEAIRLYTKNGYEVIPNFGQYENVENSVCMKKDLVSTRVYSN